MSDDPTPSESQPEGQLQPGAAGTSPSAPQVPPGAPESSEPPAPKAAGQPHAGESKTQAARPADPLRAPETLVGNQTLRSLEVLHGVELEVTVELGRARMLLRDLLGVNVGSVVELDRQAGSPVDVLVNGAPVARGEVVVVDDEFAVRITELVESGAVAAR